MQKSKSLHSLSKFFLENSKPINNITQLPDDEVIDLLCQIKGIGLWTAQMFLIFSLGRLDILQIGDVGFKRSFVRHYSISSALTPEDELLKVSENWIPYRSIAAWYLWRILDNE